jgi:hypothetical protein
MKRLNPLSRIAAIAILAAFVMAGCEPYMSEDSGGSGYTPEWQAHVNAIESARVAEAPRAQVSDQEAAREICVEGSMAECQAACDGGHLAMCVTLAQELHSGARVAADPDRADRVLAQACNGGRLDACLQRGIWLESSDVDEAADLFMRGCEAQRTDSVTTTTSCALWMSLLDAHVFQPNDGDRYAGLFRICSLEQDGALTPGSTLKDGAMTLHYSGGACGRLKDLGMSVGTTRASAPTDVASATTNPYAPKW